VDAGNGGQEDGGGQVGNQPTNPAASLPANPIEPSNNSGGNNGSGGENGAEQEELSTSSESRSGETSGSDHAGFDVGSYLQGLRMKSITSTASASFTQTQLQDLVSPNHKSPFLPWQTLVMKYNSRMYQGQSQGRLGGLVTGDVLYGTDSQGEIRYHHIPGFSTFPEWLQLAIKEFLYSGGSFRGILIWSHGNGMILPGQPLSVAESTWLNQEFTRRMAN